MEAVGFRAMCVALRTVGLGWSWLRLNWGLWCSITSMNFHNAKKIHVFLLFFFGGGVWGGGGCWVLSSLMDGMKNTQFGAANSFLYLKT